jgi:RecA/RadA recombinase
MEALEKTPPDAPFLIVWDSVAASVPRAELNDKSTTASHVGEVARAMARGCRRMFRAIARVRAHMMWINQERESIGAVGPAFMQEKKTAGGLAIGYAASLRVRCTRVQTLKKGNTATGFKIKVHTKKNRLAPPLQKAEFVLDFKRGPDPALSALTNLLLTRHVRTKGDAYVSDWCPDPLSRDEWIARYESDSSFRAAVKEAYDSVEAAEEEDGESDAD